MEDAFETGNIKIAWADYYPLQGREAEDKGVYPYFFGNIQDETVRAYDGYELRLNFLIGGLRNRRIVVRAKDPKGRVGKCVTIYEGDRRSTNRHVAHETTIVIPIADRLLHSGAWYITVGRSPYAINQGHATSSRRRVIFR